MKVELTKEQYKNIIHFLGITSFIYGPLGDFVDEKYKKGSDDIDKIEDYLLNFAQDFDCQNITEKFDGRNVIKDEESDKYLDVIREYDDYIFWDELANKLAWRDFEKEHSKEELAGMEKENGGYFGVALYDYEKKYWDEAENYGIDRLEIQK